MRTLLVTNRADRPRFEVAQVNAIVAGGGVTKWEVEQDGWELPRLDHYDCVVFFVKFRQLAERASIEWRGFSGLRVLMDHDSFQDYGGWWGTSILVHGLHTCLAWGLTGSSCLGNLRESTLKEWGMRPRLFQKDSRLCIFESSGWLGQESVTSVRRMAPASLCFGCSTNSKFLLSQSGHGTAI